MRGVTRRTDLWSFKRFCFPRSAIRLFFPRYPVAPPCARTSSRCDIPRVRAPAGNVTAGRKNNSVNRRILFPCVGRSSVWRPPEAENPQPRRRRRRRRPDVYVTGCVGSTVRDFVIERRVTIGRIRISLSSTPVDRWRSRRSHAIFLASWRCQQSDTNCDANREL